MAGKLTHSLSVSQAGQGNTSLKGAAVAGNLAPIFSFAVPIGSTNLAVSLPAFTLANLQSIFITVDVALTLKTNSSSAPQDTLNLTPAAPFVWQAGSGIANPFAGSVTSWFATNGAAVVNVSALILTN